MDSKVIFGGVLALGFVLYFTFALAGKPNRFNDLVILWCCAAIFIAILWSLQRWNSRIERGRFERIQVLLAKLPSTPAGAASPCRWEYLAPGEKSLGALTLIVPAVSRGEFTLTRKNRFISILGSIFGLRGVATGDHDMDRSVLVESPDSEFAANVFASSERRLAAAGLIARGFDNLTLSERELRASVSLSVLNVDRKLQALDPAQLRAGERQLSELSALIPDLGISMKAGSRRSPDYSARQNAIAVGELMFLTLALAVYIFAALPLTPLEGTSFLVKSLLWTAAATFVATALLRPFLYGPEISREVLAHFVVSGLCCLFAVMDTTIILNASLDRSAPAQRAVLVRDKQESKQRQYICVDSWRKIGTQERIAVTNELYRRTSPGDVAVLSTRAGWLHWEWVQTIEIISNPAGRWSSSPAS